MVNEDIKDVLERISYQLNSVCNHCFENKSECESCWEKKYYDILYSAVKKQNPKKLKPHKSGGWICTKCNAFFEKTGYSFIDISYCAYCGQAIDWSE